MWSGVRGADTDEEEAMLVAWRRRSSMACCRPPRRPARGRRIVRPARFLREASVEQVAAFVRWQTAPNHNAILAQGAATLRVRTGASNVHHCANLGYCGMGCPIGAKQSMLVTTIPAALAGLAA